MSVVSSEVVVSHKDLKAHRLWRERRKLLEIVNWWRLVPNVSTWWVCRHSQKSGFLTWNLCLLPNLLHCSALLCSALSSFFTMCTLQTIPGDKITVRKRELIAAASLVLALSSSPHLCSSRHENFTSSAMKHSQSGMSRSFWWLMLAEVIKIFVCNRHCHRLD